MNPIPFWQTTQFEIMVAGWLVSTIIALPVITWHLSAVYNRLTKVEDEKVRIAFTLGVHEKKINNLRDAAVIVTNYLHMKHSNPHPDPQIRRALDILIDWENERGIESVIGD